MSSSGEIAAESGKAGNIAMNWPFQFEKNSSQFQAASDQYF
jgi:hypothetical protein